MFTKLLKHEVKSCAPLLGILSACLFIVAILTGLDIRFILSNNTIPEALYAPGILFAVFAYLSLFGYLIACLFVPISRFYKSRFTDEGYLTFTLPAKTSHIFLSSAVNIMIWQVVEILVVFISIAGLLLIAVPMAEAKQAIESMFQVLPTIFADFFDDSVWIAYLIILPINWLSAVVLPMTAVVIGSIAAKKHKILAAIGTYYGITILSSILSSAATASLALNTMLIDTVMSMAQFIVTFSISAAIVPALLTVCGYLLSIHLMKRKLNLP